MATYTPHKIADRILLATIFLFALYSLPWLPHNSTQIDLINSQITSVSLANLYNSEYLSLELDCIKPDQSHQDTE